MHVSLDVEFKKRCKLVFEIFIDKDDGITIEDCEKVSRELAMF